MEHQISRKDDLLSRVIHGARVSPLISLTSLVFSLIIGIGLGTTAGYFGGWYENLVMRICDILMCIPVSLYSLWGVLQNTLKKKREIWSRRTKSPFFHLCCESVTIRREAITLPAWSHIHSAWGLGQKA